MTKSATCLLAFFLTPIFLLGSIVIVAQAWKGSRKLCLIHPTSGSSQCCASELSELSPMQQKALGYILASFIDGRTSIGSREVGMALGVSAQDGREVILRLHYDKKLVHYDIDTDQFLAVFPFSPRPTSIQVELGNGKRIYAMCGYDALGMPALFKDRAIIRAKSPVYGDLIKIEMAAETVHGIHPATSLLWISESAGSWAERKCGETLFFTSKAELAEWLKLHPGNKGYFANIRNTVAKSVERFGWLGELIGKTSASDRGSLGKG